MYALDQQGNLLQEGNHSAPGSGEILQVTLKLRNPSGTTLK